MNLYYLLFFLGPFVEYFTHVFLHKINHINHERHHYKVRNNKFQPYNELNHLEKWPGIALSITMYLQYYLIVSWILYYWIVHSIIHYYPKAFPTLYYHHISHHIYSNHNYGVSSTFVDKLMGTYKKFDRKKIDNIIWKNSKNITNN